MGLSCRRRKRRTFLGCKAASKSLMLVSYSRYLPRAERGARFWSVRARRGTARLAPAYASAGASSAARATRQTAISSEGPLGILSLGRLSRARAAQASLPGRRPRHAPDASNQKAGPLRILVTSTMSTRRRALRQVRRLPGRGVPEVQALPGHEEERRARQPAAALRRPRLPRDPGRADEEGGRRAEQTKIRVRHVQGRRGAEGRRPRAPARGRAVPRRGGEARDGAAAAPRHRGRDVCVQGLYPVGEGARSDDARRRVAGLRGGLGHSTKGGAGAREVY